MEGNETLAEMLQSDDIKQIESTESKELEDESMATWAVKSVKKTLMDKINRRPRRASKKIETQLSPISNAADEKYLHEVGWVIIQLQDYCRYNYIPIFNHPSTTTIMMNALT